MSSNQEILRIENLQKSYGNAVALREVSLSFKAGECVGIIGRSGAGKSTLLRTINRMISPTQGRIIVDGTDVTRLSRQQLRKHRREVGMIFQQFNLVRQLSVIQNVLSGRLGYYQGIHALRTWVYWFPKHERDEAINILNRLRIGDQADKRASDLSGGQQQRVAIARALIQKPKIFLADEPVSSVDPRAAEDILYWLQKIAHEDNIAMLINIHNIELATKYMDRIVGIAQGKVLFDGPPSELSKEIQEAIYADTESPVHPTKPTTTDEDGLGE